jgi:hypothetical protein
VDNNNMDAAEIARGAVDGIGLPQDRNKRGAIWNEVMEFGFHKMLGTIK